MRNTSQPAHVAPFPFPQRWGWLNFFRLCCILKLVLSSIWVYSLAVQLHAAVVPLDLEPKMPPGCHAGVWPHLSPFPGLLGYVLELCSHTSWEVWACNLSTVPVLQARATLLSKVDCVFPFCPLLSIWHQSSAWVRKLCCVLFCGRLWVSTWSCAC